MLLRLLYFFLVFYLFFFFFSTYSSSLFLFICHCVSFFPNEIKTLLHWVHDHHFLYLYLVHNEIESTQMEQIKSQQETSESVLLLNTVSFHVSIFFLSHYFCLFRSCCLALCPFPINMNSF